MKQCGPEALWLTSPQSLGWMVAEAGAGPKVPVAPSRAHSPPPTLLSLPQVTHVSMEKLSQENLGLLVIMFDKGGSFFLVGREAHLFRNPERFLGCFVLFVCLKRNTLLY